MVNMILDSDWDNVSDVTISQMDTNQDGAINVLDVVTVVQIILGNIS